MVQHVQVDLSRPPEKRWEALEGLAEQARKLAISYVADLGGVESFAPLLDDYRAAFLATDHGGEIDAIARLIGRPADEVLLANLYYDAFRSVLGCTAFALDTPSGPIHARNLDWWTERNMLADYTVVAELSGGSCPTPYKIVTWPGAIGVFSAVAEARFAITLNAVISTEPPQFAESITLLLRRIFDTAPDYVTAVKLAAETALAADCLLLITGTRPGEMAVVERTSTTSAVRGPQDGFIVVTNDYRRLNAEHSPHAGDQLHETACLRFDRASALVGQSDTRPRDAAACFAVLQDEQVKMGITVQHMVMQASSAMLEVRIPAAASGHRQR